MAAVVMSSPCPSCKSPAASSEDYPDPDPDPDADRCSEDDDYFKPLKRLCMVRLNCEGPSSPSPRASIREEAKEKEQEQQEQHSEIDLASKPMAPTPFSIRDILERKPATTKRIVRPWDLGGDTERPAGGNGGRRRPGSADDDSRSDKSESDCPESPPAGLGVGGVGVVGPAGTSPLDALFEMTSKTFEGLNGGDNSSDSSRDHLHIFSNRQQPKKKRKSRTAFTNHQIFELEKRFLYQKYLSPADRDEIAQSLGLTNAQVITWFQNRRAKLKRDMEELKKDVDAAKGTTPPLHKNYMDSIQDLSLMKAEMQSKKHTAVK